MAMVTATATVLASTAGALYLDAKCALKKDLDTIITARSILKDYLFAAKAQRLSLYYLFEEAVKRRENEDCIWSREGCYTWNQVYERVNQYAQWYLSQGVQPHDLVSFYITNSPDFVFAWLGLWAIGAAPAMINYNLAANALVHCLRVAGSKLILVDDDVELMGRIEDVRDEIEKGLGMKISILDDQMRSHLQSLKAERPEDEFRAGVKGNNPMCIFYTSGTTGMPKGVPFNIDRGFAAASSRAGSNIFLPDDRWYDCMPMYHGTGGVAAISKMLSGTTLCIGKKFSTSKFWDEVRDSRATWITYVGETARYLLAAPASPRDGEHHVRGMYGNGLRPDVWIKFRDRFGVSEVIEFFASSEGVFQTVTYCKGNYFAGSVGHQGAISRYLSRNLIVPVQINQATGVIARNPKTGFAIRQPYEVGGEIIVAVPDTAVFAGYYRNPEATGKKFEKNVFKEGDLWFRSGDALKRTPDGRWFFLDRLGDTFRWKGENVSTAEVAEVLGKYPGVIEANVYGVTLPCHDGRAGCAAIFLDPSLEQSLDFAAFLKYSRIHLPKYAVPVFVRLVKEMTPIHNNKQNKVPLREEGVDPDKIHAEDKVFWIDSEGRGTTYIEFQKDHWENLKLGKSRL
ncbi:hypothetical protein BJ878DRAFT_326794 [Calycina marina]|uniref:Very long-chain fatty acid transport protein n=1 Tax=Calycina marina TaxID=1763456 RepID=A0A9P8CIR4_9HELO|nr:hypothetical protein BJ878DRAFT_326794 [Calycina marina]